jgi:hypothetical protein
MPSGSVRKCHSQIKTGMYWYSKRVLLHRPPIQVQPAAHCAVEVQFPEHVPLLGWIPCGYGIGMEV